MARTKENRENADSFLTSRSPFVNFALTNKEKRKRGKSCNFLIAPKAIIFHLIFSHAMFRLCLFSFVLGSEVQLKLRLSSTLSDVKLSVYSKDSIFACKKKLQVRKNLFMRSR